MLYAAAGGLLVGLGLMQLLMPEQGVLHQSAWAEARGALVGGRFRVVMHCPMRRNRVGYYAKAASLAEARHALGWMLPACELEEVGIDSPGFREDAGLVRTWYRGDFLCPSSFHRKSVTLAAGSLDAALATARQGARGCGVLTAEQIECPLLAPGCERGFRDLRAPDHPSGSRFLR